MIVLSPWLNNADLGNDLTRKCKSALSTFFRLDVRKVSTVWESINQINWLICCNNENCGSEEDYPILSRDADLRVISLNDFRHSIYKSLCILQFDH